MRLLPSALIVCLLSGGSALAASVLEDGDAAHAAGNDTQAAACYQAALGEEPALARNTAFMAKLTQAKAGACCEAAERLMAGGNGKAALAQAQEAVRQQPESARARTLSEKAKLAAADQWFAQALKAADAGQAAEADKCLAEVLALSPTHAQALAAKASLAQHAAQTAPKDSALARALAAQEARDWAVAEAAWLAARKDAAVEFPARIGLARAKQEQAGARQAFEAAKVARAAGRLEEAQLLSEKALAGWPALPGANIFHDDVVLRRQVVTQAIAAGAQAGKGEKWGAAAAAYREALAQDPALKAAKAGLAEAVLKHAEDLAAHGRLGAALMACRRGRGASPEVDHQAVVLARRLQTGEMPVIKWKVTGEQSETMAAALAACDKAAEQKGAGEAAGQAADQAASEVGVRVVKAQAKRAKTDSAAKSWEYVVESEEANPDYQTAQVKLTGAEDRWNEAVRQADAAGKACADHSPTCTCAACTRWHGLTGQAAQWQTVMVDLLQDRNQTARNRVVREKRAHAYTEETWQATGKWVVEFTWPNGETVEREATIDEKDAVRVGADPKIGLAEDKLELPDEKAMAARMAGQLAKAAQVAAKEQAVVMRAALLRRAAQKAEKEGDGDGALELRAKAAALLGAVSEELAEKELKALE